MAFDSIIVDYAKPMLEIDGLIRRIHDLALEKNYEAARDKTTELLAQARMLTATFTIMAEKEKNEVPGVRKS